MEDYDEWIGHDPELAFKRKKFHVTTEKKWTVSLLQILDHMNAPDYAYGSILKWAHDASADGYDFRPRCGLDRSKSVDYLTNSVLNGKLLLPYVRTVDLPHGGSTEECATSDVVCFDFVPQLLMLLQNRDIMIADNLAIDIKDPLKPYSSPNGTLDEALSGSVYREAYDRYITEPSSQLFVPIIQWIDRTTITGNERFSLKPYMFTPAIFKETFRRSIKAWGYHGFLPKKKKSMGDKELGNNIRNYHAELREVLASYRNSTPHLKGIVLPIGPQGKMKVDIITCVLFIIQDMQEGDMLCGRYGTHTSNIYRHCRACDVSWEDLDNPDVICEKVNAADMAAISWSDQQTLREWSQHQVDNVFNEIEFADPERGIFGATPIETLHCIRKGIIEYVSMYVVDNITPKRMANFDALPFHFHKSHHQTYRKTYPSTDFSRGVAISRITASERVGLVFLLVILFQYDEGWRIMQESLGLGNTKKLPEILQLFESLLCFDAWANKNEYSDVDDPIQCSARSESIRRMMHHCKQRIRNVKKKSKIIDFPFRFPKFHEILHLLDDIKRFGAPMNFCAQRPESLLIPAAKQPGRRAQKRHEGSAYELGAAQRLSHSFLIDVIYSRVWDGEEPEEGLNNSQSTVMLEDIKESTGRATFGFLTRHYIDGEMKHNVKWSTRTNVEKMKISNELSMFVYDTFAGNGGRVRLILSDDTPCPHENSFFEKWRHMEKMVSLAGHALSRTQQIFAVSEDVTHGFSISTHQNRVFRVSTSESRVSIGRHTKIFLTNRTTGFLILL